MLSKGKWLLGFEPRRKLQWRAKGETLSLSLAYRFYSAL